MIFLNGEHGCIKEEQFPEVQSRDISLKHFLMNPIFFIAFEFLQMSCIFKYASSDALPIYSKKRLF